MTYTYRRTWPDQPDKQDFSLCYDGHAAGRKYARLIGPCVAVADNLIVVP